MDEDLQEADSVQLCIGGMIELMALGASMETTRIRDPLVSLGGEWNGVAGTRDCGNVGYGEVCYALRCTKSPEATRSWHYRHAAGNFKEPGMIFARRAMTARWGGAQLIEKTAV